MSNIFRDRNISLTEEEIRMMNPISLAFVGDAVYELLIRTELTDGSKNSNKLHKLTSRIVKASSQSEALDKVEGFLTEDEKMIVRRGRNAKSHTIPKNAKLRDYKNSTALEALFGYLYLMNEEARIIELLEIIRRDNSESKTD